MGGMISGVEVLVGKITVAGAGGVSVTVGVAVNSGVGVMVGVSVGVGEMVGVGFFCGHCIPLPTGHLFGRLVFIQIDNTDKS